MIFYIALVLVVLFLGFVFSIVHIPSPRVVSLFNPLPGPSGIPVIGIALKYAVIKESEILDFFDELTRGFGRLAGFWIVGIPHVFLRTPEDIEQVMTSTLHISKGVEYDPVRPWLNEGLLLSSGKKWHFRRKLLTPAFHFRILQDSLQNFNKNSSVFVSKLLEQKGPIKIMDYAKRCAIDVICESVMGVPLDTQNHKAEDYLKNVTRMAEVIVKRELSFWLYSRPVFFLSPTGFEFRKLRSTLQNFTNKVIEERKRTFLTSEMGIKDKKKKKLSFLDLLLEPEANNQGSLSKDDIREEVDTFMFEGHDTTSSALSFIFLCLGNHADVQEKVIEELDSIFGDSTRDIEASDISKMTYLDRVIKETMRLYPPVPYMSRRLENDLNLDGKILIPKGCNIIMIPYLLHRNPAVFPNPEEFNPERFTDEESSKRNPFAYIPFSAGPRNCIGQKFALMELKVIVANVLRKARVLSLTKREDIKLSPLLILKPDRPIELEIIPRQ